MAYMLEIACKKYLHIIAHNGKDYLTSFSNEINTYFSHFDRSFIAYIEIFVDILLQNSSVPTAISIGVINFFVHIG